MNDPEWISGPNMNPRNPAPVERVDQARQAAIDGLRAGKDRPFFVFWEEDDETFHGTLAVPRGQEAEFYRALAEWIAEHKKRREEGYEQ